MQRNGTETRKQSKSVPCAISDRRRTGERTGEPDLRGAVQLTPSGEAIDAVFLLQTRRREDAEKSKFQSVPDLRSGVA